MSTCTKKIIYFLTLDDAKEVFLKAAEYVDVNPADCVVVEDALAGLAAAKAAGMIGGGMGDNVDCTDGDYHIDKFAELLEFKGEWLA